VNFLSSVTFPFVAHFVVSIAFPSVGGIVYSDVADATARLSLLGISAGYRVHQVDNNTVYQYNGASTAAVAGMIVAGTGSADGICSVDAVNFGKNHYFGPPGLAGGVNEIGWDGSVWTISDVERNPVATSASNVATPNLATWTGGVTVTIDHIASVANWTVIP
jgi:hypothetical protein